MDSGVGGSKTDWRLKIKQASRKGGATETKSCLYRGKYKGLVECTTCPSKVKLKTYECALNSDDQTLTACTTCDKRVTKKSIKNILNLEFNLSNQCNLNCAFCYAKTGVNPSNKPNQKLIDDTIAWFFEQCKDTPADKQRTISIFGGEPLVEWEALKHTIEETKRNYKYNIKWTVVSNIVLLDEEKLNWLVQNNIGINASVDGNAYCQDMYRIDSDGNGKSEIVFENLKRLLKERPRNFVRSTITPQTVHEMFNSTVFLYELGVRNLAQVMASGVHWDADSLDMYEEQCYKIADWWMDLVSRGIWMDTFLIDKGVDSFLKRKRPASACGAGRSMACVDTKGNIWPCHRFAEWEPSSEAYLGNIYDGGYTNLRFYEGIRAYSLRNRHDSPACNRCEIRMGCSDHCLFEMQTDLKPNPNVPIKFGPVLNQGCRKMKVHNKVFQYIYDCMQASDNKFFFNNIKRRMK